MRNNTPTTTVLLLTSKQAAETLAISPRNLWALSAPRGPIPVARSPLSDSADPSGIRSMTSEPGSFLRRTGGAMIVDPLDGHFEWLGRYLPFDPYIEDILDCWSDGERAPEPTTEHERELFLVMHPSYDEVEFRACQLPPVEPLEPTPEPLSIGQQERLIHTTQTDERFRLAMRGALDNV